MHVVSVRVWFESEQDKSVSVGMTVGVNHGHYFEDKLSTQLLRVKVLACQKCERTPGHPGSIGLPRVHLSQSMLCVASYCNFLQHSSVLSR
jgi:hypothetical protein